MDAVEGKLKELGLQLPPTPKPMAQYIPAKLVGDLVFVSGQGPMKEGKPIRTGRVGAELTVAQGAECARLSALNCLAAVKSIVGTLDAIEEIVQLRGFVNSAPDFEQQPEVLNGASELMVQLFGEKGRHVRAALGTCSLPRNIPVELEMVARVKR